MTRPRILVPLALALCAPIPALASSDDAWAQFRLDVEAACTALLPAGVDLPNEVTVEVNPFGSERYGVALIVQAMGKEGDVARMACIYDKVAKTAELTAPFAEPHAE